MFSSLELLEDFVRVSRRLPCPVCGKPDWCLVCAKNPTDPDRVICKRVESALRRGDAGWLHQLRDGDWKPRPVSPRVTTILLQQSSVRMAELSVEFESRVDTGRLQTLGLSLGLSISSLLAFHIGWSGWAWSFPMFTGLGQVAGIRLRRPDGKKLAVRGSKDGIFIPRNVKLAGHLFICEGPTDAAAILDKGYFAVGRPSCSGGSREIACYVRQCSPTSLVIVADNGIAGIRGAESLAVTLLPLAPVVKVVFPPDGVGDARDWMRRDEASEEFAAAVDEALPRRATIRVESEARSA